jgi:histone H3/H4
MAKTKLPNVADASAAAAKKAKKHARILKSLDKDAKKSVAADSGIAKKPHRWRRGTLARRQCHKYQSGKTPNGTRELVPKTSMTRRIRDKAADYTDDVRFQAPSLSAVQQSTEALMVDLFTDTARLAHLCGVKTVSRKHFLFVVSMYFRDYEYEKRRRQAAEESARQRRERKVQAV